MLWPVVGEVALAVAGVVLIGAVLDSALRTFVLPRGARTPLTRWVFVSLRALFDLLARPARSYERRDRVMALYAPIGLLSLVGVWVVMVITGFTFIFRAVSVESWTRAFELSGSSFLTLGFVSPPNDPGDYMIVFAEAAVGLGVLALLISYLPTIYSAFSRREVLVAKLSVRAGEPPSGVEILIRAQTMQRFNLLDEFWTEWQTWFAELEETHTSLGMLSFFRSPQPDRSWVTAAGSVLDAAALYNSVLAVPWSPNAGACVRGGFLAMRTIADYFGLPYDPDPASTDPISIARDEFDAACRSFEEARLPMKDDRDQAWRDFQGWRVNYDAVLLALAGLTMAPYAPWSSDRSLARRAGLIKRLASRRPRTRRSLSDPTAPPA
ncbi:MAG: hypothetical protein WEA75_05905 [Acidimicrobiia bacterium]